MGDGYNFKQLKTAIIELSSSKEWETAKKEWKLVGVSQADEPETCPCGHHPIIDLCELNNKITGSRIEVGNVCVKRFLGFRSDLIFGSIKRIRKDLTKSIGVDANVFFRERNVTSDWEYHFQQDTRLKRNLSVSQITMRRKINLKILASIERRGIS